MAKNWLVHDCKNCGGYLKNRYKSLYCGYKCWKAWTDPVAAAKRDEEKSRASTFRSRLNYWQRGAECRGIVWALTEDEFASLWGLPCTYCGGSIETIGIDRKNSNIGYRLHNCVPCCSRCNMMKGSRSTEEFVGQCMAVAAKWAGDDSWRVPSKPVKAEKRKKKHKKKKKREVKLRIEVFGVSPGVQLSLF